MDAEVIRLDKVSKSYGGAAAVRDVSFSVGSAETCVLVGPSGCGKTTTLRMINRVIEPSGGSIRVRGSDIASHDPVELRRSIGYVIQQVGLFPHMTVEDNVGIVPRLLGVSRQRRRGRVEELLHLVGLDPGQLMSRYPGQLSGGQQQRVGVARALAADPDIILMDEPFGAVDPLIRRQLQKELRRIQTAVHKAIVFVTHDLGEALYLADRIILMNDGRIAQQGTSRELLFSPDSPFVAEFFADSRDLGQLALMRVADITDPGCTPGPRRRCARVYASASLLEAVKAIGAQQAMASDLDPLGIQVLGPDGSVTGELSYLALAAEIGRLLSPAPVDHELSAVQP